MPLNNFRQIHLPYCLERQKNGEYVVLNRQYKPVGFYTYNFINYDEFPISVPFKITKATAKKLSFDGSDDLQTIYLYNDGCLPDSDKKKHGCLFSQTSIANEIKNANIITYHK